MSTPNNFESVLGKLLTLLERSGDGVIFQEEEDTKLLAVGGQPIGGPDVAYGQYVLNTSQEIGAAVADARTDRFSQLV